MTRARIAYVAGYGRSGSTALDLAISLHPEVLSLGEAMWAPTYLDGQLPACTCGALRCSTWSRALGAMGDQIAAFGLDPAAFVVSQRRTEFPTRLWWRGTTGTTTAAYGAVWGAFFDAALAANPGVRWVVDSSKTSSFAGGRAQALARHLDRPVVVVDLHRSFAGVLTSLSRGSNASLERTGGPRARWLTMARGAVGHVLARLFAGRTRRSPSVGGVVDVAYEDFVGGAEGRVAALTQVMEVLELSVVDQQRRALAGIGQPIPGHMVSGNRMRMVEHFSVR